MVVKLEPKFAATGEPGGVSKSSSEPIRGRPGIALSRKSTGRDGASLPPSRDACGRYDLDDPGTGRSVGDASP